MTAYASPMLRWNIGRHLDAKGWENANQLATGAGLSYPVARRIMQAIEQGDGVIDRVDAITLGKLAKAFGVPAKKALTLLEFLPDE